MARPRLSISRLMILTACLAAGLALIQVDRTNGNFYKYKHDFVIGVTPLGSLLIFGLITSLMDLLRQRRCSPFVVGFEAAGWLSLFAYTSFLSVHDYGSRSLDYLSPVTNFVFPNGCAFADIPVISMHMTILFVPQLAFALIGGFVAARLGVNLVRGPVQSQIIGADSSSLEA